MTDFKPVFLVVHSKNENDFAQRLNYHYGQDYVLVDQFVTGWWFWTRFTAVMRLRGRGS